jgi:hypothetical protein
MRIGTRLVLCAALPAILAAATLAPGAENAVADKRLDRIRAVKMPPVTAPIPFDTPEADAVLAALEVFPSDNAWNQVIADWPLHADSKRIVESIGAKKPLRCNADMAFVIVPANQPRVAVKLTGYTDESDPGPYPVPDGMPIEGWPASYRRNPKQKKTTLKDVQRDTAGEGGDRHALIVDPVNRKLYEFYQAKLTDHGWTAAQASIFDLTSNKLRPDGWTSTDAAGLPIFPAVVRYDELQRGAVEHAMRITVRRSLRAYVAPATHFASRLTDPSLPRMGERLRLRKDFDVSHFSPNVRAVLVGLQRYGAFVADNGIEWAISVAPDERIADMSEELRRVKGEDFEVVVKP